MTQLALTLDEWNPYFVAYARSQGRTPAEEIARHRLWEYTEWIAARWREWDAIHDTRHQHGRSDAELAAFGAWLNEENQ